jgi:hypothetical protein
LDEIKIGAGVRLTNNAFPKNFKQIYEQSLLSAGSYSLNKNLWVKPIIANVETTIHKKAFYNYQLTSIDIPIGITTIEDSAFAGNRLSNIIIHNSITSIGVGAFADNPLTKIIIGSAVKIDNEAFRGNFKEMYEENKSQTAVYLYFNNSWNSSVSIPDDAFSNQHLTSIFIPENTYSIGKRAFSNNQLTDIEIPNTVSSIDDSAFSGNPITKVLIGADVELGSNPIPNNFKTAYSQHNKKAGTYEFKDGRWRYYSIKKD